MLLALAMCAAVCLPNLLWALGHRDLALLNATKFHIEEARSWWEVVKLGVKNIAQSLLSFGGPLGLIYAVVFFKARALGGLDERVLAQWRRLMLRAWMSVLVRRCCWFA